MKILKWKIKLLKVPLCSICGMRVKKIYYIMEHYQFLTNPSYKMILKVVEMEDWEICVNCLKEWIENIAIYLIELTKLSLEIDFILVPMNQKNFFTRQFKKKYELSLFFMRDNRFKCFSLEKSKEKSKSKVRSKSKSKSKIKSQSKLKSNSKSNSQKVFHFLVHIRDFQFNQTNH